MTTTSVLYDLPGPKARRRARIGTGLGLIFIAALLGIAAKRLADNDQFAGDKWSPLFNPGDENFALVWEVIAKGLGNTVKAAVVAIALSLILGVLLGVARMMLGRWWGLPIIAFIQLFRGLPVIITIFLVWRIMLANDTISSAVDLLPDNSALWYLAVGLALYNSVIIAEILRAGVNSLPRGQAEAGLAIGMSRGQVMRSIQLPQAFRVMLPALVSQLIVVLKDTSLVAFLSALGYIELLQRGNQIAQNLDNPIQTLLVVGAIFIILNYALSRLAIWLEGRLSRASGDSSAVAEQVPAT